MRETLDSRRIEGWAIEQASRLGVRKQAPVLTLQILAQMEHDLCSVEMDNNERLVVGASVFMVASRA
eukprot:2203509-Karenia_brevis.AAC.1